MPLIQLKRTDDAYAIDAMDENRHILKMDAAEAIGGRNTGFRPMQTILAALGGCSAIDVLSILKKQRQEVQGFEITIDGVREQGKEPALWKHVHILFCFAGTIEEDKARKACSLSIDKYCSVAATLRAAGCTIEWDVKMEL